MTNTAYQIAHAFTEGPVTLKLQISNAKSAKTMQKCFVFFASLKNLQFDSRLLCKNCNSCKFPLKSQQCQFYAHFTTPDRSPFIAQFCQNTQLSQMVRKWQEALGVRGEFFRPPIWASRKKPHFQAQKTRKKFNAQKWPRISPQTTFGAVPYESPVYT